MGIFLDDLSFSTNVLKIALRRIVEELCDVWHILLSTISGVSLRYNI